MRQVPHVLMLVTLVIAGVALFRAETTRRSEAAARTDAAAALARLQREVNVRSVLGGRENARTRTWPSSIDPAWFGDDPPRNPLVGPDHPWLEIASARDLDRAHPREVQAVEQETAGFWYNPATGIVRARVPAAVSDRTSLDLYNELNGARLDTLWPLDD